MSILLENSNTIKVVSFGKFKILDNQTALVKVFRYKPKAIDLDIITSQDITSKSRSSYSFVKKYKLDVFLYLWKMSYAGHVSVENSLRIQDVCHQIS